MSSNVPTMTTLIYVFYLPLESHRSTRFGIFSVHHLKCSWRWCTEKTPFYNILTFTRRLWPHTVLYWPHIVLLLDHILQCITPWRWPRRAETCRSVCIYNKHTEVHLLDVIILNVNQCCHSWYIGRHSSVMSVRPSVRPSAWNSAPTGRILSELDIWAFFENISRKFKVN